AVADPGGGAGGGRAAAGAAADAVLRVADLWRDLRRLEAERVGRDHRDERALAGADVLRAEAHGDAAVGADLAVRDRGPAAAAAPRADRHAHAGLDRSRRRIAGRVPLAPAERLGALAQVAALHRVGRLRRQVLDPELDRIQLHQIRELVHHDLGDERPLRMPGRAHRTLRAGVDE